ncbi:MAG: hypothetical protein IJF21_01060 [Clostridia bacterium]|nr:hypothetical protein [Clostridia bacterium]
MRATIISICIFCAILIFATGNTIYINMKVSDLIDLARDIDQESLPVLAPEIEKKWEEVYPVLQINAIEEKLRSVSRAVSYLGELNRGADLDIRIVRSDLIRALEDIASLERPDLLQIF